MSLQRGPRELYVEHPRGHPPLEGEALVSQASGQVYLVLSVHLVERGPNAGVRSRLRTDRMPLADLPDGTTLRPLYPGKPRRPPVPVHTGRLRSSFGCDG